MKNVLIYGKGLTGEAVKVFCEKNGINYVYVDDRDYSKDLLKSIDTVVVSPGVPFFSKIFKDVRKFKKEIISEVEFAYRFLDKNNKIVAITGTDGKSTTVKLTSHFLSQKYPVYLGGNYGVPFISLVEEANKNPGIIVLELSSFQLYTTKTLKPYIAAFLNFSVDHLNWHKKLLHYFLTKQKLFKEMAEGSIAILNYDDRCVRNVKTRAKKMYFSTTYDKDIKVNKKDIKIKLNGEHYTFTNNNKSLLGIHNQKNIAVAAAIALILGIPYTSIQKSIETFVPLPHRLEFVREINGIRFFNDSKSTTLQSLKTAIETFDNPVILIAGGLNKGTDFSKIKELLQKKVKKVILIGKSKDEIKKMIDGCCSIEFSSSLEEAVIKAYQVAETKDIILLSPGCASFDMFRNYEERGEVFKRVVNSING